MAFPLETTHLIAHLRAFNLATVEDESESASKIIKPLLLGLFYEETNALHFKNYRPLSPPIPYDIPTTPSEPHSVVISGKRLSTKAHAKKRSSVGEVGHARSKSRTEKPKRKSLAEVPPDPIIDENTSDGLLTPMVTTAPSQASVVSDRVKKKEKLKNPLVKLFQKSDKTTNELGESDSSSVQAKSAHDSDSLESGKYDFTFDLDPVDTRENSLPGLAADDAYDAATIEEEIEEDIAANLAEAGEAEEEDEDEYEGEDLSSSDSAFTDIEADSMIDVEPSMMYEYTVPESYILQTSNNAKKQIRRKNKNESESLMKSSKPPYSSLSKSSVSRPGKMLPPMRRRSSISFDRMQYAAGSKPTETAPSNLSLMIQSRFKSTNTNPLAYYGFASSENVPQGALKVKIDVFVPPKMQPVIKQMEVNRDLSIHDCIGYVLLLLTKLPDYKADNEVTFMNPNYWRMELIDEDGELYDSSFGVLDRSRLLKSYNCPNCLALCKVTNPIEIASNEKQSPLPLEFKQNLELFQKRLENAQHAIEASAAISPDHGTLGDDTIEVKIDNIPTISAHNFVSFFISSGMKVGDLLSLICEQYHIDPTKYELTEGANKGKVEYAKRGLDTNAVLSQLGTNQFRLIPNSTQKIRPMIDVRLDKPTILDTGITPTSVSFISAGITPPVKPIIGRFQEMAIDTSTVTPEEPRQENKIESFKKTSNTKAAIENISFGDLLHKESQLPTTLNTIYFKWKVFRKKSPLLNRIEKALIIDGDYIHLAPTDDTNWKKNPYENPFSASNTNSHHHHHYLHHYNYSKYYNDSMMKTSSFHVTQIVKLKPQSKNPNHFKIVINKQVDNEVVGKEAVVKKKFDLEAESVQQCKEIIEKIKWALQVYNMSAI